MVVGSLGRRRHYNHEKYIIKLDQIIPAMHSPHCAKFLTVLNLPSLVRDMPLAAERHAQVSSRAAIPPVAQNCHQLTKAADAETNDHRLTRQRTSSI